MPSFIIIEKKKKKKKSHETIQDEQSKELCKSYKGSVQPRTRLRFFYFLSRFVASCLQKLLLTTFWNAFCFTLQISRCRSQKVKSIQNITLHPELANPKDQKRCRKQFFGTGSNNSNIVKICLLLLSV